MELRARDMSKRLKRRTIVLIVIELISLCVLGVVLSQMQTSLSLSNYRKDTQVKMEQMNELVQTAHEEAEQVTETYDDTYRAKADSIAYMAKYEVDFEQTNAKMVELQSLLDVDNVLIVKKDGSVVAKAQKTNANFTYERFNQLRSVFEQNEPSRAFEVSFEEANYRYYAAKINDDTMVVIEQNTQELAQLLAHTNTWESMLSNVKVGLHGYTFAISAKNYLFLYHPEEAMVNKDALDAGISVDSLEDGTYTWMQVNHESIYAGVAKVDDTYIVCAIPESEIQASQAMSVAVVLFVCFSIMTIVVVYGVLLTKEEEQEVRAYANDVAYHSFYYHKNIGKKTAVLSFVGILLVSIITFYMQTLFTLSRQSMSNDQMIMEVQNTLTQASEDVEQLTEEYNRRYLNKCETAAYILSRKPELATRIDLKELSQRLEINAINVFDESGVMTATSSSYTNFKLSDDPKSQSYEFKKLLQGVDHLIQEAQPDEISREYYQYIGVSLRDEIGDANGFVQIQVRPFRLENILANTQLDNVLDGIKVGMNGFTFAIDQDTNSFVYYPEEKMIGRDALEYGLEEKQLRDGYQDYITVDSKRYYGASTLIDQNLIYVVEPDSEMNQERLPITMTTASIALISMCLLFIALSFSKKAEIDLQVEQANEDDERAIEVTLPDGRVKRSESAASRWANITVKWDDLSAEQQIATVIKWLITILGVSVCMMIVFKDTFLGETSILNYVIEGHWDRSINIFAITGCILIICAGSIITMVLKKILKLLSKTFGARGETVCRLMSNFLKYLSVIAILYYCFALFGVDTQTLLASAGILSLVIGLGAKSLVTDILAGLFIIFEGEFRVGDIVKIGDWRGTVVEIGIRTTKIEDGSKNIKIFSNSDVSGVINMTRRFSYAFCDVGIEYGESLERVENILAKEFPNIKARVPSIQDGPFYKGVVSLGDNSVNIRIMAQCKEGDRIQLERDLNREMKLIFDRYDINIPFPQVVLNQPTEFKKATTAEKKKADDFNAKQKEASKGLGNEEEEEK